MATQTKPDQTRPKGTGTARPTGTANGRPTGELTIGQRNAIDVLILGGTHHAAATAAGVTRPTVTGWANHDAQFQATLNQARAALWAEATDKLRAMVPRALEVLEVNLEGNPDPKVALDILKLAGIGGAVPTSIGPTTVGEIEDAVAEGTARRALAGMLWRD